MKIYIWMMLFAGAFVACSDDGAETPAPPSGERKPVWEEYSHARLMRLQGAVRSAREYFTDQEAEVVQLTVSFDASGRCTSYNPTGIEPDAVTYGWGQEAVWFDYRYDASGRMSEVTRYAVGADPQVYTITYGTHESYIPAPFPLGNIEPLMLRGVVRIESDGYLLTSNGQSAESQETTGGWFSHDISTSIVIADGLPVSARSVWVQREEEIKRVEITYTYSDNWLSECRVTTRVPEEEDQVETTGYSSQWPCSPVFREITQGQSATQLLRVEYSYTENGLPKDAVYTVGIPLDANEEFKQWYNSYDAQRNWTSSTKEVDGTELVLSRVLSYY